MDDLISFVEAAFSTPASIVIVILTIAAAKGVYEFICWVKKELDRWYDTRHVEDTKKDDFVNRMKTLEENDALQFEKLASLEDSITTINDKIEEMARDNKEAFETIAENARIATVAQVRNALYCLSNELRGLDHLTIAQSENWCDLRDLYLLNNGNSIFKEKIIPEIDKIPVRE